MTGADLRNGVAAAVVVAAAIGVMVPAADHASSRVAARPRAAAAQLDLRTLDNGGRALVDATGELVPLDDYQRIVAGSTVAREVLIELIEPRRLTAVVDYDLDKQPDAFRYDGIARIPTAKDAEAMLALSPDLVVVHGMRDPSRIARMREAGLRVFDLGNMRGLVDLRPTIAQLGVLTGVPERARDLTTRFERRFAAVAADITDDQRKTAMYASVFGDRVFGGTVGSSFHELLTAARLIDVAAERYEGWPSYGPEDLLMVNPQVIVTQVGMGETLCRLPGADGLRACANGRAGVVEVPGHVLNTPGLSMLEAAELIREGAHGPR